MTQTSLALDITRLKVRRSKSFSLQIDSLKLEKGKVTCLVGANGSGKTTLIETIVGLLSTYDGQIRVCGMLLTPKTRKRIHTSLGFIPDDENWIIPELCADEFFALLLDVYKGQSRQRIEDLCMQLHFTNRRVQIGSLSHGNKKKLQIIAALFHDPKVLIVDELRNGLDPVAILQVEYIIKDFVRAGGSVLASTHDLWWAERFSEQTILIHEGKVMHADATAKIVADYGSLETKFKQVYGLDNA